MWSFKKKQIEPVREKNGKYKTKERDMFLLWGEYPKGWSMVKDLILCLFLINAFIASAQKVDIVALIQSDSIDIENPVKIETVNAAEEVKAEPIADTMKGTATAYNSEEAQTDSDPFTMASGKRVHDGAIANNCLSFGTKVKIEGKVYVVEDRMNKRYGCDSFDIWMANYDDAIKYGKRSIEYSVVK